MRFAKYLCAVAVLFASCRASRNTASEINDEVKPTIAVAVSPGSQTSSAPESVVVPETAQIEVSTLTTEEAQAKPEVAVAATKTKKKVASFAQMKEMAEKGEIAMSKKDLKILNRLERHYKGNYEKFRAETFEFTNTAKIVGGVGLLGLLLGIITGSGFGWFLFIIAALAFLLRYLNIISF